MTSARKVVDYRSVSFSRSDINHHDFINQEIQLFEASYNELCSYDARTECLSALVALGWFFGSVGTVSALFVCLAYLGLSHEFFGRPALVNKYQSQLQKLLDLYGWCCAADPKASSADPSFLKLAESVMPFVAYKNLIAPFGNVKNLSDEFARLLVRHPLHRDEFLMNLQQLQAKAGSWIPRFVSNWFSSSNQAASTESTSSNALHSKTWSETRKQTYAQMRFFLYSHQTESQLSYLEQGKQLLQPYFPMKRS